MPRTVPEDLADDPRPSRRHGRRPKAAGRLAARALVERLAWAKYPLVYWTGTFAPSEPNGATNTLQRRFRALAPGAYAVRLNPGPASRSDSRASGIEELTERCTPIVAELVPVNASLIARSLRRLADSRRFPVALPRLVGGDAAAWRASCEEAISRARAALDAMKAKDFLALGRVCLVIGSGGSSGKAVGRSDRNRPFSAWPPDVLAECEQRCGHETLKRLARTAGPSANRPHVASAVLDRMLLSPETAGRFLNELPALLELEERLAGEPRRRLQLAAAMQTEALRAASDAAGAAGQPVKRSTVQTPRVMRLLQLFRYAYHDHLIAQLDDHFAPIFPAPNHDRQSMTSEATSTPAPSDLFKFFGQILTGVWLRSVLMGSQESAAAPRRGLVRWAWRGGEHRLMLAGFAEPLTFDNLPSAGAQAVWSLGEPSLLTPPPPVPSLLDLAAAGVLATPTPDTAAWLDAVCRYWPLGESRHDHARAAMLSLHVLRGAPAGTARALGTLAGPLLQSLFDASVSGGASGGSAGRGWQTIRSNETLNGLPDAIRRISRATAAGVDESSLACVVQDGLMPGLDLVLHREPAQAPSFVRFFGEYAQQFVADGAPNRTARRRPAGFTDNTAHYLAWAFLGLGAELSRLTAELVAPHRQYLARSGVAGFLSSLGSFVLDDPGAAASDTTRAGRSTVSEALPALRSALDRVGKHLDEHRLGALLNLIERCLEVARAASLRPGAKGPTDPRLVGRRAASCMTALVARTKWATSPDGPTFFPYVSAQSLSTLAAIAGDDVDRLIAIGGRPSADLDYREIDQIGGAWHYLGRLPPLQDYVSRTTGREGQTTRALRVLSRLGLCLRLHRGRQVGAALANLVESGSSSEDVEELRRWRPDGKLPERIVEILGRESSLRREFAGLEAQPSLASPTRQRRIERLRQILADADGLGRWKERDLGKHLPAAIDDARLARLEQIADAAIDAHFAAILGSVPPPFAPGSRGQRNWDNALRLYYSLRANRSHLRRLLRSEAASGDRAWIRDQPSNAKFVADVARAGIDAEAWLAPFEKSVETPAGPCRIALETEPLHVLQMGNYFETCLSEGQMNAFSTVANAVEVNKRVVYVYDARGVVVGRKLIALTRAGELVGYHSYGRLPGYEARPGEHDHNPVGWRPLKDALDDFCVELARRCRARLHPDPTMIAASDGRDALHPLALFAKWYDDGPEAFDARCFSALASSPPPPERSRKWKRSKARR